MNLLSLSLRVRIFLFFALIIAVTASTIGGGLWSMWPDFTAEQRRPITLYSFVLLAAVSGVTLWVWVKFDEHLAKPLLKLATGLGAQSATETKIDTSDLEYLGSLGPAAKKLCDQLENERRITHAKAEEASNLARLQSERLGELVQNIDDGIVFCNAQGTVLLYNRFAYSLLESDHYLGLGRVVFDTVIGGPLEAGTKRLFRRHKEGRCGHHPDGHSLTILTGGLTSSLLLTISLLIDDNEEISGFLVLISDQKEQVRARVHRDQLLEESLSFLKQSVNNFNYLCEIIKDGGLHDSDLDMKAVVMRATSELTAKTHDLVRRERQQREEVWPIALVQARSLAEELCHLCECSSKPDLQGDLMVRCDSFTFQYLLLFLFNKLKSQGKDPDLRFLGDDQTLWVDIRFKGSPVLSGELEQWLGEDLGEAVGNADGQNLLMRHRTTCWSDRVKEEYSRSRLRIPLAVKQGVAPKKFISARPDFYDFALPALVTGNMGARSLKELQYCVFDTETTGLNPSEGDEIVQISAVRIVNLRLLRGEIYDVLVNPGRNIPAASTKIHGISNEMVKSAMNVSEAISGFYQFSRYSVLIAHNAAFDLKFLSLKEQQTGLKFNHPVLDTALLSALLFEHQTNHSLDGLCERLDISIPPEDRHTALGDSLATASAFIKMISMLEASGIKTLSEAIEASNRMYQIKKHQRY